MADYSHEQSDKTAVQAQVPIALYKYGQPISSTSLSTIFHSSAVNSRPRSPVCNSSLITSKYHILPIKARLSQRHNPYHKKTPA